MEKSPVETAKLAHSQRQLEQQVLRRAWCVRQIPTPLGEASRLPAGATWDSWEQMAARSQSVSKGSALPAAKMLKLVQFLVRLTEFT